jgi:hypothetical protein
MTGPGWYTDPGAPGRQRYWNGAYWTAQTRPVPVSRPGDDRLLTLLVLLVMAGVAATVLTVAPRRAGLPPPPPESTVTSSSPSGSPGAPANPCGLTTTHHPVAWSVHGGRLRVGALSVAEPGPGWDEPSGFDAVPFSPDAVEVEYGEEGEISMALGPVAFEDGRTPMAIARDVVRCLTYPEDAGGKLVAASVRPATVSGNTAARADVTIAWTYEDEEHDDGRTLTELRRYAVVVVATRGGPGILLVEGPENARPLLDTIVRGLRAP